MFCTNCGSNLPDNSRFCTECGAQIAPPVIPSDPQGSSSKKPRRPKRLLLIILVSTLLISVGGVGLMFALDVFSDDNIDDSNGSTSPKRFIFLDDVTVKRNAEPWDSYDNIMIVPQGEDVPEVGDIIVFGTSQAVRVESLRTNDDVTAFTYSRPKLHEFLDSMNIEGQAPVDFSKFIPADGVTIIEPAAPESQSRIQPCGFMDDWFDVPETEKPGYTPPTLSAKVDLGRHVELNVDLTISIPTVSYKFDIDFFEDNSFAKIRNAYVKFENSISVHVDITASDDHTIIDDLYYPPYIELGTIPLVGVDGVGIVLEVDLVLSPQGKFELDFGVNGTLGVQILNNEAHNLSTLTPTVSVDLAGEIKIGPQLRALAEVFGEDLLSFSADAGIKGSGSAHIRSNGVCCMDARITAYAEVSAFKDCLVAEWLDIGVKYTLIDENNSPINIGAHFENLKKVDQCSFTQGSIKGTVANADNRTQYIENAKINILNYQDLSLQKTAISSANGTYTAVVPASTYLVQISADGYIPFESVETVTEGQLLYLETYLLVEGSEDANETGTIGGQITNSLTGSGVNNVTLTVRKGWNMTTGNIIYQGSSDDNGNYTMNLPLGNYTICIQSEGYVDNHINIAVTKNGNMNCNAVISPDGTGTDATGELRIVLTWTGEPSDLDSHLWGPVAEGYDYYHIFFQSMEHYENGEKAAYLDLDDTDYYGPETTTVYNMSTRGTYSFYVHDYTNRHESDSSVLANSGAKVQVYIGDTLVAQFFVPTTGNGTVWHVFNYNAATGQIYGVNEFSTEDSAEDVGRPEYEESV